MHSPASIAGPPDDSAGTDTTTRETLPAVIRTCPVPIRQMRLACRAVAIPQMTSAAKAAQTRYCSDCFATSAAVVTAVTMGVSTSSTPWNPANTQTKKGHDSSGS